MNSSTPYTMDYYPPKKSSSKVFEVVRRFQILSKWKKLPRSSSSSIETDSGSLRRAASFPLDEKASTVVPKGCFVVSVGEVRKRFVVPTRFLAHPLFGELLREAEEEFGFQQKGVLRIPCDVFVFEHVLRMMKGKKKKNNKSKELGKFGFECHDYDYDSGSSSSEYVSSLDFETDTVSKHLS